MSWQTDGDDLIPGFERRRARVERVAASAERQIAPRELLDGPDTRILWFPLGVGLRVEGDPRGQVAALGLVPGQIEVDPRDHESEAAVDPAVGLPREIGDFV